MTGLMRGLNSDNSKQMRHNNDVCKKDNTSEVLTWHEQPNYQLSMTGMRKAVNQDDYGLSMCILASWEHLWMKP